MSCCDLFYLLTKKLSAAMMTSWIPNFSGFMKKSRNEAEVLGQRSLSHESKPSLTHVTDLSLDSGPELIGDTEILSPDHVSLLIIIMFNQTIIITLLSSDFKAC